LESAQFYYEKAQKAENAGSRVGFATQLAAEGQSLGVVATDSTDKVDKAIDVYSQQRRRQTGPVELTPRGGTPVPKQTDEPQKPEVIAPSGQPKAQQ
jgi:hypothetical protein